MVQKKAALLMIFFCLFLLMATFTGSAHAATFKEGQQTTTAPCMHLDVFPHGSQPATMQCVDRNSSAAHPNDPFCSQALRLWRDANGQGPELCFTEGGEYDLTNFTLTVAPVATSWNDQASSFATGCASVTFYKDIQRGGSSVTREPHHGIDNFTAGSVPNDSLSSVFIVASC